MSKQLLKYKKIVEQYLPYAKEDLSVFSFVNIFAWKDFFDFDFKMINGNLCIFAKDALGSFMYLPPLGKNVTEKTIEKCFCYMKSRNGKSRVARIENISEKFRAILSDKKYSFYHKANEYFYKKEDIMQLRGNAYKSKRSDYNFFIKNYDARVLPFKESMARECLDLYEAWAKERKKISEDEIFHQMLEDSRQAHQVLLKNAEKLGFRGLVVKIKKKIKAYTFGFEINKNVFCVFGEVADLSFKGLPTFIFKELAQDIRLKKYKFLNVMDDFGLDNITRTKMSFRPALILPMSCVKEKD
ncbi:MAG TPA: phosphatidylglycerol lysyltransferase domain-containing protein [Candidatus Omnitrophota bacterium]|nr:phosphatidylglycerol lysyltransferase domain-containing protein [Candidatus Omnitrophota bacterium]HPN87817.1 phosphatidylglycerol lysyltransferase domain-containing protein [Candidatus Omnitrophota bacterium]